MKKCLLILCLCLALVFCLAACGESSDSGNQAAPADSSAPADSADTSADANADAAAETSGPKTPDDVLHVTVAATPSSGQVFQFISEAHGFAKEEGVDIELVYIDNVPDALTALAAGKVNAISTYGTGGPLVQIAQGVDLDIFGGYMIIGETPIFGKPETEFKDLNSFVGKKIGLSTNGTADSTMRCILWDAGIYDQVEWVEIKKSQDVLQAIANGEIDFGGTPTGHQIQAQKLGLEVKMWPDEYYPNHSCCRMLADGTWIEDENNQEALYRLLRAYLRAEEYFQTHKEEAVELVCENLDLDKETVESFVLSEHFELNTDPYKSACIKMWNKFQEFGRIDPNTEVNIEDHINTAIYERALTDLINDYPDSQFFKDKMQQFEENDK